MRRAHHYKLEVDVQWQQKGPDEWVALITDRKTGRRLEARSETELREVLESLRDGAARSPAPAPPAAEEVKDPGESRSR